MKKILSIILCFVLCVSIVGCSSNSSSNSVQSNSENVKENKNYSLELTNGTFKVGEDLDPGEYILVKNEGEFMGNYDITTDTTGDMESSIDSNAFENFSYIEVKKGQYLQLDKCTLYIPSELGDKFDFSNEKELTNGMFRVGKDVEPGEYKLEIASDDDNAQGWYSLYNNLGKGYKGGPDLQDSDFFSGSKLITLKEGQYLKLDSETKLIK
ncbi:hypothetical protein [Intestinibacter bartlettii]|uniref:hypothetical protein n=1 Tax=Intestinibacter bartlettii TaxID=261299 RepID=UPI003AB217CB